MLTRLSKVISLFIVSTLTVMLFGCATALKQPDENEAPYVSETDEVDGTETQSLYDPENYLEIIDGLYKKAEGKENVLANMKDGLTDPVISEMYAGDISDAKRMTESGWIKISYYDYDLNDDGLMDKIVIIQSALHGGTGGNPFDVLIAKEDGGYNTINNLVLRVFPGEDIASMYILDDKTNGYHDILIKANKPAYDYTPVLIQKQTDDTYLPVIRRSDALHYVASYCIEGITEDEAVSLCYDVLGDKAAETGNEIRYVANTTGKLDGEYYYCITAEMYDGDSWVQTDELMVAASGDAIYVGERIYEYHLLGVLWKK